MKKPEQSKPGRILRVRFGLNPNSSSLATDLSMLIKGAASFTLLVNLADWTIRRWRDKKKARSDEQN